MTRLSTGSSAPKRIKPFSRKILIDYRSGKGTGSCSLIQTNVRTHNDHKPLTNKYCIHDTELQIVKNAKYLGVTVSSDLSWNKHVDNTVKKATTSLNFLKRNIHGCPTGVKDQCYKSIRVLFLCMGPTYSA